MKTYVFHFQNDWNQLKQTPKGPWMDQKDFKRIERTKKNVKTKRTTKRLKGTPKGTPKGSPEQREPPNEGNPRTKAKGPKRKHWKYHKDSKKTKRIPKVPKRSWMDRSNPKSTKKRTKNGIHVGVSFSRWKGLKIAQKLKDSSKLVTSCQTLLLVA